MGTFTPRPYLRRSSLRSRRTSIDLVNRSAEAVQASSHPGTIMARYVFGDELKPGERWKRRVEAPVSTLLFVVNSQSVEARAVAIRTDSGQSGAQKYGDGVDHHNRTIRGTLVGAASKAGLDKIAAFQLRPGTAKGPP